MIARHENLTLPVLSQPGGSTPATGPDPPGLDFTLDRPGSQPFTTAAEERTAKAKEILSSRRQ